MMHMVDNKIMTRIAQKIRTARLSRNMTIQQLASRSRVSKGLLSKIENARTIPSLPVFVTIIESLETTLKEFFDDMLLMTEKNYLHIRKDQFTQIERERRQGFSYQHILSQAMPSSLMEVVLLTVEPDAKSVPVTMDAYEFKYVLTGSCGYLIQDEMITLEEGDVLYFDGSISHVPVNTSGKTAVMLVIYFMQTRH
jgi:transcriptional regulator with XRE-family HTH domain